MKNLFKILLSPISNLFIGIITGWLLASNYKFLLIYCIMAPFATGLMWLIDRAGSSSNKNLEEKFPMAIYFIAFVWSSIFWMNNLVTYTRIVLFPEEAEVKNV